MFVIFAFWPLFLKHILSIILARINTKTKKIHDHDFVNSMIHSCSPEKRAKAVGTQANVHRLRALLSDEKKRDNIVSAYEDLLIDVVNFLFLPGLGCLHL